MYSVLWRKASDHAWAVYAVHLTQDEAATMVSELRAVGCEARRVQEGE